ncbi:MAG TPA: hypothetical protein ENK57_12705, partial [Polyangiaceae bacterium]|nr:hypothetical protein [Polyangiaceae bacterium]
VGGMGYELRPSRVDVLLVGPRSSVEDLPARRVIPFVDVGAFDPALGAQQLRVELQPLPEDLTVTVEPSQILVLPVAE